MNKKLIVLIIFVCIISSSLYAQVNYDTRIEKGRSIRNAGIICTFVGLGAQIGGAALYGSILTSGSIDEFLSRYYASLVIVGTGSLLETGGIAMWIAGGVIKSRAEREKMENSNVSKTSGQFTPILNIGIMGNNRIDIGFKYSF